MARLSPRKKPQQGRSQATVSAIVEAAAQVLADEGVQALTTKRIAERAGVSIGSLYQYFPSKQAVIFGLVHHQLELDRRHFGSTLAALVGRELRYVLEVVVAEMCTYHHSIAPLLVELLPMLPELQARSIVHAEFESMSEMLRELLRAHRACLRPELRDEATLEQTRFILAPGIRGALNAATEHDRERLSCPIFQHQLWAMIGHTLLPDPEARG